MEPQAEPVTVASFKQLVTGTFSKWSEINAPRLCAALSFYTMLSIAPLLVVTIAIAGMAFGEKAARGQIVYQIQSLVGTEGGKVIQSLLEHAHKPGAGAIATIAGVIMLLFGASGVFVELRDSMNLIWGVHAKNSSGLIGMVKQRFTAFAMVMGLGFLLLVSLLVSAAITAIGHYFQHWLPLSEGVLHIADNVISFVGLTVVFGLLYKSVPDTYIEWRDVGIGAAVTAALFSIGKFLIGLYIGQAALSSTFGAAGSLVVFLVWVYYSAQVFFLGAEFTHAYAERHGSRAETRAVRRGLRGRRQPQTV